MKSLKPRETQEYALTKKTADELKDEIIRLQQSVVALQSEIEGIETQLEAPTVGRGNPVFDSVTTTDLTVNRDTTIQDLQADEITATKITSPDIETENITVSNVINAAHVNTPDLDAEVGSIEQLQSENISVDVLAADEATIPDLTANTATIGTANITTANVGTYNIAKVDATEVETPLLKATESVLDAAAIEEAEIEDAVINNLEAEDLWNRNRWFKDDTKRMQITGVNEDQPGYICIDTKGVQTAKIVAKDEQGELFTVIYSNTRGTPLIQWSKRTDFTLNKFFYGFKTNKLYLQVWQDCSIQWQIDAFEDEPFAPTTYSELPESLIDCHRYNVGRKSGIVLMGDNEDGVVLSVQGTIEGNFLVDSGEFTYINFYSDSAYDLFKVAKAFFRTGSDEDGWRYEKAQVFGYLRHTDTGASHSPYRDEDNTEIEALEKVEYVDENTILLTIDNKYGQDEITIVGNSLTEDEKLPFVLGFTFRTPRVDAVFNEDSPVIPGSKGQNYIWGD